MYTQEEANFEADEAATDWSTEGDHDPQATADYYSAVWAYALQNVQLWPHEIKPVEVELPE